jgi:excisionase family DNA binding protein
MQTNGSAFEPERLMTPGEVAQFFKVAPKTVTRWALAGKIPSIRTLGGHRRFKESDVLAAMQDATYGRNGDRR